MARVTEKELLELLLVAADAADELGHGYLAQQLRRAEHVQRRMKPEHLAETDLPELLDLEERKLEDLVDRHGLGDVVMLLANICSDKADHLRTYWDDRVAARDWERAARRLNTAARNVTV